MCIALRIAYGRVQSILHIPGHALPTFYVYAGARASERVGGQARALIDGREAELMEKCGVHNSIIDCRIYIVVVYASDVFTHPQRRRRCAPCIILVIRRNTDVSFARP